MHSFPSKTHLQTPRSSSLQVGLFRQLVSLVGQTSTHSSGVWYCPFSRPSAVTVNRGRASFIMVSDIFCVRGGFRSASKNLTCFWNTIDTNLWFQFIPPYAQIQYLSNLIKILLSSCRVVNQITFLKSTVNSHERIIFPGYRVSNFAGNSRVQKLIKAQIKRANITGYWK